MGRNVSQGSPTPPVSHSNSPAPQRPKRHEKRRLAGTSCDESAKPAPFPSSQPSTEILQPMVDEDGFTLVTRKGKQRTQYQQQDKYKRSGTSSLESDIKDEEFPELLGTNATKHSESHKQDVRQMLQKLEREYEETKDEEVLVFEKGGTVVYKGNKANGRKLSEDGHIKASEMESNSIDDNSQKTWGSYMKLIEAAEEEVGGNERKKSRKVK